MSLSICNERPREYVSNCLRTSLESGKAMGIPFCRKTWGFKVKIKAIERIGYILEEKIWTIGNTDNLTWFISLAEIICLFLFATEILMTVQIFLVRRVLLSKRNFCAPLLFCHYVKWRFPDLRRRIVLWDSHLLYLVNFGTGNSVEASVWL